jgi:anti-sigma-K factor RskA
MSTEAILSMKHWVTAIILSVTAAAMLVSNGGGMMTANAVSLSQTGALIGYGGQIFGLVDVSSDGHQTDVKVATNYLPPSGKTYEVWMVDGNYYASGYPLSLGQIDSSGKLKFTENMMNAYTYTDIMVTVEPTDDKDPKPAWSQAVGAYLLAPPFGQ